MVAGASSRGHRSRAARQCPTATADAGSRVKRSPVMRRKLDDEAVTFHVDEVFTGDEPQPGDDWKRCACSRLVPLVDWVEPHGCCDDCYWALPDSREQRAALMQDDDRDRLVDEERD